MLVSWSGCYDLWSIRQAMTVICSPKHLSGYGSSSWTGLGYRQGCSHSWKKTLNTSSQANKPMCHIGYTPKDKRLRQYLLKTIRNSSGANLNCFDSRPQPGRVHSGMLTEPAPSHPLGNGRAKAGFPRQGEKSQPCSRFAIAPRKHARQRVSELSW